MAPGEGGGDVVGVHDRLSEETILRIVEGDDTFGAQEPKVICVESEGTRRTRIGGAAHLVGVSMGRDRDSARSLTEGQDVTSSLLRLWRASLKERNERHVRVSHHKKSCFLLCETAAGSQLCGYLSAVRMTTHVIARSTNIAG